MTSDQGGRDAPRPEVGRRRRGVGRSSALLVSLALLAATAPATACAGPAALAVPRIDDARDVRGADPCALLPRDRATGLRLAPGVATTAAEGPRCEWRGAKGLRVSLTLYVADGALATLAANSEPTTARVRLEGYPALETFTDGGGFCQYDVGIAADQVVLASVEAGEPDSCSALQSLLPSVLARLPT